MPEFRSAEGDYVDVVIAIALPSREPYRLSVVVARGDEAPLLPGPVGRGGVELVADLRVREMRGPVSRHVDCADCPAEPRCQLLWVDAGRSRERRRPFCRACDAEG